MSNRAAAYWPFSLREEQQSELSCGMPMHREGVPKTLLCKKPLRSLLKLGESKLPALSLHTETVTQEVLRSQSWDLQVESGSCRQAEQGPAVPKKKGVWHATPQEQRFVVFALEAGGKTVKVEG